MLIRADGSKNIGMGHLNRVALIASEFSERTYNPVIMMKDDVNGEKFLSNKGVQYQCFSKHISVGDELKAVYDQILAKLPCIFLMDILYHDEYQDMLKRLIKEECLSIVITDECKKTDIKADIVINGNPHQLDYDHIVSPGHYLMGPEYFIMDSIYEKIKIAPPSVKDNLKILITVGGSDHNDLLFLILEALEMINVKFSLSLFVTSVTGYMKKLISFLDKSKLAIELNVDESTLAPFWGTCDLAITAGGNTLLERIASRLPGATVCQLDRQMAIANYFEKLGVNVNVGLGVELSLTTLSERIEAFICDVHLHETQYVNSQTITSGKGLSYLLEAIEDAQFTEVLK